MVHLGPPKEMRRIFDEVYLARLGQYDCSVVLVHPDLDENVLGRIEVDGQVHQAGRETAHINEVVLNTLLLLPENGCLAGLLIVLLEVFDVFFYVSEFCWRQVLQDVVW